MNILFDIIPLQYEPNMKYHGGGEYVKKIFFKLLENSESRENKIYFILSKNMKILICKR